MYSLRLICAPEQVDLVCAQLWESGTCGVQEVDLPDGNIELLAGFETNDRREHLLQNFHEFRPEWRSAPNVDWVAVSERAWPGRSVAHRLFLATPWCEEPTPPGRLRIVHNPGIACGTGEHPCTRLALDALERLITPETIVADIGTGSGILSIAAQKLGARYTVGVDLDTAALLAARQNFALNGADAALVAGSANCLQSEFADVVVANISPSVLLTLADELLRILRPGGRFILTGFEQPEAKPIAEVFPPDQILIEEGWACLICRAF